MRSRVVADIGRILKGPKGFGVDIDLISPDGTVSPLRGFSGDITAYIEPDTGALVKGKRLHVTLFTQDLPAGDRPKASPGLSVKPWRVSFPRITTGVETTYAVIAVTPDDSAGSIVIELGTTNSV